MSPVLEKYGHLNMSGKNVCDPALHSDVTFTQIDTFSLGEIWQWEMAG